MILAIICAGLAQLQDEMRALRAARPFRELAPAVCVEPAEILLRFKSVRQALAVTPEQDKELNQVAFASERAAHEIRDVLTRDRTQAGRRALLERLIADPLLNRQLVAAGIADILTKEQAEKLARIRAQMAGPLFLCLPERPDRLAPEGRLAEACQRGEQAMLRAMAMGTIGPDANGKFTSRPHEERVELALAYRPKLLAELTAALSDRQRAANTEGLALGRKVADFAWPRIKACFDGTATVRP